MRYVCLCGLWVAGIVGCGPAVANSSAGTDGDSDSAEDGGSTGSQTGGSSSTGAPVGTTSTGETGDPSSSGDSSTGGPSQTGWCWSSEWTDALGIQAIWSDDTHVLAAAGSSIVRFDGDAWEQLPLEDPSATVTQVAAASVGDAWFGGDYSNALIRLEGDELSTVALPLEEEALMSLELDGGGQLWVLVRPNPPCGIGPCPDEDAQLYRRDGEDWVQSADAAWVDDIDIVGDTMWAVGEQGMIAHATPGQPWTFVDTPIDVSFDRVHAVSSTELWIVDVGLYWHYVDGVWSEAIHPTFPARSFAVDASGVGWWLSRDFSTDTSRLERMDAGGPTIITEVPESNTLVMSGGDALLGGREGGNYVYRVSDLEATASISTDYGQADIGGFSTMFVPSLGQVIGGVGYGGFGAVPGLQRHRDGAWSRVELGPAQVSSIWGTTAAHFLAVEWNTGLLWQINEGVGAVVPLPLDEPRLARVWGTAEDDMFVCGAPAVGVSGQVNELAVLHWDGAQWLDVSPPEVGNIGGPSYLDMHGVGEHLYVKTALRLYHYDGASWGSVFAPTGETELSSVRAYAPDAVFVIDEEDVLLMHDGAAWHVAADLFPELAGLQGTPRLTGSAAAGIYLSLHAQSEDESDALWVYRGEGWEPVELPEGLGQGALVGAAETGGELWADDGRRIWTATYCE